MAVLLDIEKSLGNYKLDIFLETNSKRISVLGPSGAGKTLLLKMISGIVKPDNGRISIDNNVFFDSKNRINIKTKNRKIGYMFQNYALFPNMNVRDNIGIAIDNKDKNKAETIEKLIHKFRLSGLENHMIHQLSGGQQQRVALARIFSCKPETILLDEPFSALDFELRESLQRELFDFLSDYEGTVIMVTHNIEEARRFSDQVVILESGRIKSANRNSEIKGESTMKLINTRDAVGMVLCHDITRIIKDVEKGPVFRKGHIIKEEDIPVLLSVGKEHIYVWENDENMLHENDAAMVLYDICKNENIKPSEIKEGKVEAIALADGLLEVDSERLKAVNGLGEMMIATRHGGFPVKSGDVVAGMRVIPLVISKEKMEMAKKAGGSNLLNILPFKRKKCGIITTGSEVYNGLIEDRFTPVVEEKLREYNQEIIYKTRVNDESINIEKAINEAINMGCNFVLITGGMSVDPDDRTPLAIKNMCKNVVSYGAPVLPGAMFMLAYTENGITVVGLPGCVMYAKRTIFDIVLPRILAEKDMEKEDISALGEGGLCLNCPTCIFPNCGFGKDK